MESLPDFRAWWSRRFHSCSPQVGYQRYVAASDWDIRVGVAAVAEEQPYVDAAPSSGRTDAGRARH